MLTNRILVVSPKNVQSNSAPIQVEKKKISASYIFSKHHTSLYKNAEEKCKPTPNIEKPSRGHVLPFPQDAMIVLMLLNGFLKYRSQSID